MRDDVMTLLSAPAPNSFSQRTSTKSSASGQYFISATASTNENFDFIKQQQQQLQPTNNFNDFDLKIKELEQQAKQLKEKDDQLYQFNNKKIEQFDYGQFNLGKLPSNSMSSNGTCTSSTAEHLPVLDIKSEESYLKKVRSQLDLQLKETEQLKQELNKSKQLIYNENTIFQSGQIYRPTGASALGASLSSSSLIATPNALIDEVVDLRMKLKESQSANEEIKTAFKKNLTQLQNGLKERDDVNQKILAKKERRMKELEEECDAYRANLNDYQKFFKHFSFEQISSRMRTYEEFYGKLKKLLTSEGKKREKSYFVEEMKKNEENKEEEEEDSDEEEIESIVNNVYKGIVKCVEDYQGEVKHSKVMIKQLQISWDAKEKQLDEKESILNKEFNKKCETMRDEYDALLNTKNAEIAKLNEQIDELTSGLNESKETWRKKLDAKEVENKTLLISNSNFKRDLTNSQEELKQMKLRLDTLKLKEKENQANFESTLKTLEQENEQLNKTLSTKTSQLNESVVKLDAIKCQLTKYEQLIDNLNEQMILLKRDSKEAQLNYAQINQSLEGEKEAKCKLESQMISLQKELNSVKNNLITNENLQKNYNSLQSKFKQVQIQLTAKISELGRVEKVSEENKKCLEASELKVNELSGLNSSMENQLKSARNELNEVRIKMQNSAVFIQHSCKANTMLKEEKDAMEKTAQENAMKLKLIKGDYDKLAERFNEVNAEFLNVKCENEANLSKLNELRKLNEMNENEKERWNKEASNVKSELKNLQVSYKTLNRKLGQTINEKETHISQLQQSLVLHEKEINLLKQAESLHKTQEESKVTEMANNIQLKLAQKKNKIEQLKAKLNSTESNLDSVKKEKIQVEEEKAQLELRLKNSVSRIEAQQQELLQIEQDFNEFRQRVFHYEKALEKAANKYSNAEKKNSTLENDLNKLKQLIKLIVNYCDVEIVEGKEGEKKLEEAEKKEENIEKAEKLISFISSQTDDFLNRNFIKFFDEFLRKNRQITQVTNEVSDSKNNNCEKQSLDILLESTVEFEQSIVLNESLASTQETNRNICDRIESRLNELNKNCLNLKKESCEVTNLLLQNGTQQEEAKK